MNCLTQIMNCLAALAALSFLYVADAKLRDGDCEVCIKFLSKFEKTLEDADRSSQDVLTEKLKKACSKAKNRDRKFCFYIGATPDAATYIVKEVTKPLGFYKPADKICENLKKKDAQICDLVYEKELDWKNINLKKMRVKELKKILGDWEEDCKGCVEKSDFIKKIESVRNKHVEL